MPPDEMAEYTAMRTEWKRSKLDTAPTECRHCGEIDKASERGLCDRCEHKYTMAEMDDG